MIDLTQLVYITNPINSHAVVFIAFNDIYYFLLNELAPSPYGAIKHKEN